MWGWDPSKGEGPAGGTTPTLVPTEATSTHTSPPVEPHPVLVTDVQGLKQQFQHQQNLLAQIKETLRENDADRTSKEKQLEMYAAKLSQIKSRSKNAQRKTADSPQTANPKLSPRRASKENLSSPLTRKPSKESIVSPTDASKKAPPSKGKMNELKKRLEENKQKFEEQTERGLSETKRIETMVEQLKSQVQERDVTIHELQKTIDTPPTRPKVQTLPRRAKDKPAISSKYTQTSNLKEVCEYDIRIRELEATVVDLEDTIKQQESVIAARTKAVALLTEDLSKKGKVAVDDLEETRQEMRTLQNNFIANETQLKSELLQKDNRLTELEEKIRSLETLNAQLTENHGIIEAQLSEAVCKCLEKDTALKLLQESANSKDHKIFTGDGRAVELEEKVAQLTKELDDSNKLMIRLKLEHKNKMKATNKTLDQLKKSSDGGEVLKLNSRIEQLEAGKVELESKIAELEEEKALEENLKQRILDLEKMLTQKDAEIVSFEQLVAAHETEKVTWQQSIEDQSILVDNLSTRIQNLETGTSEFEPFEIPGDGAARQFDISNKELQKQIEYLVSEKQELLDKLKNAPNVASTDSLTFEKVDFANLEPEIQIAIDNSLTTSDPKDMNEIISHLTENLLLEQQKSAAFFAKIKELEKTIEMLDNPTTGDSKGKNKIQKLERELFNTKKSLEAEKEKVQQLCDKLEDREKLIREYIEKMEVFGKDDSGSENQRLCLSLENSLLELGEQCERLRKENIEVVHQLSEEKVRRKGLEEGLARVPYLLATAEALEQRVKLLEGAADVGVLQEKLEYFNVVITGKDTEIFSLHSTLADRGQEVERLKEELEHVLLSLSNALEEINCLKKQTCQIGALTENKKKTLIELRESANKASQLEEQVKIYSSQLKQKTDECSKLIEERNRYLTSLEAITNDNELNNKAKYEVEVKYRALEDELREFQSKYQEERNNWEHFIREIEEKLVKEKNEALMKAEEAEKVLQKTWAERNDLIHSKQDLLLRLADLEKALSKSQTEKNEVEECSRELALRLESVNTIQDKVEGLKQELELRNNELQTRKVDYDSLTLKAKKLAANLKKKAQVEKDLTDQVNALNALVQEKAQVERDLTDQINVLLQERASLLEQVSVGKGMTEKWVTEGSEKEALLKEKEAMQALNQQLLKEKEELQRLNEELANEKDLTLREAEAAFAEKCKFEEEYTKENARALSLFQQLNVLTSEHVSVTDKLKDLERQWAVDKANLESLQEQHLATTKHLEIAQQQLNALEQTFQLEEHENEALLNQRASMVQEQEELRNRCKDVEEQLEAIAKERTALLDELKAARSANVEIALKCETVNSEREQIDTKFKEVNEMLASVSEDNVRLLKETEELRSYLDNREIIVQNLQAEINRTTEQENVIDSILKEKENLEKRLLVLQNDSEIQISNLNSSITNLELSISRLEDEKVNLILQYDSYKEEMLNKIEEYKHKLTSLEEYLTEKSNSLNEEIRKCSELSSEVASLKTQLDSKDAEIQSLIINIQQTNQLAEEKTDKKKKKSVTFKEDDDCIKDLRSEVSKLQNELASSQETVSDLQNELLRLKANYQVEEGTIERSKHTNLSAVQSKPSPHQAISVSTFFSSSNDDFFPHTPEASDPFSEESLTWDDGWGTEGHLEEEHALSKGYQTPADNEKILKMECELKALVNEKEKVDEELRMSQVKYAKVVKKLKEQKLIIDRLNGELKLAKSGLHGDLDDAIMEELREEIKRVEGREAEGRKELEAMKLEKENLLKRIDMLNAGNERFLEMKERQDSDVSIWKARNAQLQSEIDALQAELNGPRPNDSVLAQENKELRNLMEGLEWKISELIELVDEKDEELAKLSMGEKGDSDVIDYKKQVKEAQDSLHTVSCNLAIMEEKLAESKSKEKAFEEAADKLRNYEFEVEHSKNLETALQTANDSLKVMDEQLRHGNNLESSLHDVEGKLRDKEEQLAMLVAENDELQAILNDLKMKTEKNSQITSKPPSASPQILQYFQTGASSDFFEQTTTTPEIQLDTANVTKQLELECAELRHELSGRQDDIMNILTEKNLLDNQITELNALVHAKDAEIQQLLVVIESERKSSKKVAEIELPNGSTSELQNVNADLELALKHEVDTLKNELRTREEEMNILKQQLQNISTSQTIEWPREEKSDIADNLGQVDYLTRQVQDLQKMYNDSKLEIERLLREERFRSDSPYESELAILKRSIDFEKTKFETILRDKDAELVVLRDALNAAEKELEDARSRNAGVVQQLKNQLRELDAESAQSSDEKDTELIQLNAEVTELREYVASRDEEVRSLREELSSLNRLLEEETAQLPLVRNLLEEREAEVRELKQALENLRFVVAEREAEMAALKAHLNEQESESSLKIIELESHLKERENEVRELKETLESVHSEISQFRNFDKQMRDMQMARVADARSQQIAGREGDWNTQEAVELADRLQSDLDTALYMLHQRDVRCDELTFELMQLLEERDTLQLRLSTVIRTSEELRSQIESGQRSPVPENTAEGNHRNLTDKISELHNVGYGRDKNIQDDSLQRHRDQMSLLSRDGRSKPTRPVMDV